MFRGYATLVTDVGSTAVRAGERTLARDTLAPSQPLLFNSARFDAFDRWASARRDARLGTRLDAVPAARSLRRTAARSIATARGATRRRTETCWYPTVAPGWRPYYNGYWSPVPAYGWTWIGYDAWGWPTHHYGRWGFAARPLVLGSRSDTGARRGCRGRPRRDTSAGVPSATAEALASRSASRSAVRGDGSSCLDAVLRPRLPVSRSPPRRSARGHSVRGRRSSFRRSARSRRPSPSRATRRAAAVQRAAPQFAHARSPLRAASRQTVPGIARPARRHQPEISGRVRSAASHPPSVRHPTHDREARSIRRAAEPATRDVNRYVPDTRTLAVGQPAPSRGRQRQQRRRRTKRDGDRPGGTRRSTARPRQEHGPSLRTPPADIEAARCSERSHRPRAPPSPAVVPGGPAAAARRRTGRRRHTRRRDATIEAPPGIARARPPAARPGAQRAPTAIAARGGSSRRRAAERSSSTSGGGAPASGGAPAGARSPRSQIVGSRPALGTLGLAQGDRHYVESDSDC